MRRGACVVIAFAALAVGSAAGSAPHLVVTPVSPIMGKQATIELRAALRPPVFATVRSSGDVSTKVLLRRAGKTLWRGRFTFAYSGRWTVRARGVSQVVLVRPVLAEPPPASTFVPLGEPGCTPPSPANATTGEARGRATTGDLWAVELNPNLADPHAAVLRGVMGRPFKIVWRMQGSGDATFTSIAPDGTRHLPRELQAHGSSIWNRPGDEWGSTFDFTQAGCWQIHVERSNNSGDLWLRVDS
jgi:hypothetical protein